MTWPHWLRSRSGVEHLGPPDRVAAWTTIALAFLMIVYVGAWNAAKYPIPLGYDAQPHVDYMHVLLDKHRLPTGGESGEANQPPAYYLVAGLAARAGHVVFGWHEDDPYAQLPEHTYRGAQIFNVLCVLLTALCVLWLARTIAPERPWVWAASTAFFAFTPVVTKTAAMFHPENLNMLSAGVATATATSMLVHNRYDRRHFAPLLVALAVGFATRASSIFVFIAILIAFAIAMRSPEARARVPWRRVRIAVVALVAVSILWSGYGAVHHGHGALASTTRLLHSALGGGSVADVLASHDKFFHLSFGPVFTHPWRAHYVNEAFPETYTEIWGDWIAAFSWNVYSGDPWVHAQRILADQSMIGVLPTLLALAGWLALAWWTIRGRIGYAVLALLPLVATTGYLYRSWLALTRDGDLFKAAYLLNTAPVWAIAFGIGSGWLAARSRWARWSMLLLFPAFAILELRFTLYGIRDHVRIF